MKVWMLWHGGYSYGHGTIEDDTEEFDSIRAARDEFERRYSGWDRYYPCVDEGSTAMLFFADPRETPDPYPDREITIGPRGGIRVTRV